MVAHYQSRSFCQMTSQSPFNLNLIDPTDFEIRSFDDEVRVDELCGRLLQAVRDDLLAGGEVTPLEAGELCSGADYFLREFIIAGCGDNLFRLTAERVRQFAGHWYIVRTLEPNAAELSAILAGVSACYHVLARHGLVSTDLAETIGAACADLPWYLQRIEEFWAIEGDGFDAWRIACPLPGRKG
jgi:hypothetical protein